MTPERTLELYRAVDVADLHKIRAAIHRGDAYTAIAERAGLPTAVVRFAAIRTRRAARRAARRAERAATPVA